MPRNIALSGRYSKKYFDSEGNLRRVSKLQKCPSLKELLINKYKLKEKEAQELSEFLLPMLEFDITKRASAQEVLKHPWLDMEADFECFQSEKEIDKKLIAQDTSKKSKKKTLSAILKDSDSELNMGDDEDNEYLSNDSFDDDYCGEPDIINIQNFNNSFAAYGQYVNMSSLDRANPQFTH